MDPIEDAPIPVAAAAPGPKIFQLSPLPGNIYETDRFYYDPAASLNVGPFGALLAFAAAHGHPFMVHECHDLQEFQTAHPSAVVRPISEVSPAIVARGLSLLAQAPAQAPTEGVGPLPNLVRANEFVIAPPGDTTSNSSPLLSYESPSGRGGDPPSSGPGSLPATTRLRIPPVTRIPPVVPRPDPDGINAPPLIMGGRVFPGHVGSSPLYGGFPPHFSFASTPSTADQWRAVALPGQPPAIPAFIHGPIRTFPSDGGFVRPSDGGFPHAPASVASSLASAAPSLRPLSHENLSGSASK